jgi:hypothetical protein
MKYKGHSIPKPSFDRLFAHAFFVFFETVTALDELKKL